MLQTMTVKMIKDCATGKNCLAEENGTLVKLTKKAALERLSGLGNYAAIPAYRQDGRLIFGQRHITPCGAYLAEALANR
jgi:hypothetical protein